MKKACLVFISLLFMLPVTQVWAVKYPPIPTNNNFIVDDTGTLNSTDREKINAIASELWQEKKIPIVAVIIDSLKSQDAQGLSIETYTTNLFNHWQLGRKDRNYGIILLVSLKDRKARIEMGKAFDHRYDSEASDIMQNYIVPRFKEGKFGEGVTDGVTALDKLVRGLKLPDIKQPWWALPLSIGLIILVIGVIVSLFKSGRSGWGWALIVAIGLLLWFVMRNAGSGISGGGSGGGGGATGSW